jgi:hypothetical protein
MKLLQKIISFFLAITFLVSSLGFTANKMICLKTGKVKISLVHVKNCCPEKKSSVPVLKAQCCDLVNTSFYLGNFQNSQKLSIGHSFISAVYNSFFSRKLFLTVQPTTFFSADLPPPHSGRTILSFNSILII